MPPIQLPGQINLGFTHSSGPLAQPVAVTNSGPQGIHTYVWGGLSQRLQLAVQLASFGRELWFAKRRAELEAQGAPAGMVVIHDPNMSELAAVSFELADAFLLHEAQLLAAERAADPATRPAIAN